MYEDFWLYVFNFHIIVYASLHLSLFQFYQRYLEKWTNLLSIFLYSFIPLDFAIYSNDSSFILHLCLLSRFNSSVFSNTLLLFLF